MRHIQRPFRALGLAAVAVLLLAPPALARRTIRLNFPKFDVPPRTDRELCTIFRLPMRKAFDLAKFSITNVGVSPTFTSHHFLMWVYNGTDLSAFPPDGQMVESKACLDFGPADTNTRTLIGGSQIPHLETALPKGIAQPIGPTEKTRKRTEVGIILNTHWINGADTPQRASVKVRLVAARPHSVRRFLEPLFEVIANGDLDVAPHSVRSTFAAWAPGGHPFNTGLGGGKVPKGDACVVSITSHMHKRGKLFTVDLMNGDTVVENLLKTDLYSDPPQIDFPKLRGAPLLVRVGESLQYTCTHDNGMGTPVKLGCEEQAGVTPGINAVVAFLHRWPNATGAAKRCSAPGPAPTECPPTDPAYPNRTFTGNCVEANLVFGYTSDDDMCILPGAFYPANPDATPDHECDLTGLPLLN